MHTFGEGVYNKTNKKTYIYIYIIIYIYIYIYIYVTYFITNTQKSVLMLIYILFVLNVVY